MREEGEEEEREQGEKARKRLDGERKGCGWEQEGRRETAPFATWETAGSTVGYSTTAG